jgi:preprotein translocase subunit SecE
MAVDVAPRNENFLTRVVTYYHDVMGEMRKVTWPDVGQVRQSTLLIIVFVLFVGLVIYLMDLALQGILIRLIPSLFGGR